VFVGVILIVVLGVVGYFAYKALMDENLRLQNEVVEFRTLTETLVRSSSKWATKKDLEDDLKSFMTKDDYNVLRRDIDKLGANLMAVGRTIGTIKRKVSSLEKSDDQGPDNSNIKICEDGKLVDVHGYTQRPQIKLLTDINIAPVAEVQFDASNKKPWSYDVFQRNHYLTTVVSKKASGQMVFHHKLEYSVPEKDKDKKYKVNIVTSDFKQTPEKSKMFWLNPKVDANFFAGGAVYRFADGPGRPNNIVSLGVDVGLSLSSYGPTKVDSWFRLFRIGMGYNIERQAGHFSVAPFAFNMGKPLPLLTNLYLTPQVAVDTGGGITVNLGIGPQF
jgi:hypothetical protein